MNTSTLIFKSKATPRVSIFGLLLLMLSFFTISSVNAQNISELNQFLESQEADDLRIDREYLFGVHPTIYISESRIRYPEEGDAVKIDVIMDAINRVLEAEEALQNIEFFQLKITSEDQKSGSISSSILDQMPSLKVIFILSEVPISQSEVQSIVSQIQNQEVKILYLYSQPV